MRTKTFITAGLVLTTMVGSLFSQTATVATRTTDDGCVLLLAAIQRDKQVLEKAWDGLVALSRIATPADRDAIERFGERAKARGEQLAERYDQLADRYSLTDLQEIRNDCSKIRPTLETLSQAMRDEIAAVRRFSANTRLRIATCGRVRKAVQSTDKMVIRASQLAKKTENGVDAFPGLRRAFELQEEAKQALAKGRCEVAMHITLRARDVLGNMIHAAMDSADVEAVRERAKEYWKETNRMIRRLARTVDPDKDPRVARLLAMAQAKQEKAREIVEDQPYRAIKLARDARRVVNQIVSFAHRARNCEERMERLSDRIETAEEIVEESENEDAATILEKAVSHYEKGVELCEEGKTKAATVEYDITAKLTAKAVDVAKGRTPQVKTMQREVRKTAAIVKKAASLAKTDEQKRKVEAARKLVAEAKDSTDKPNKGLHLLDKATDLAFSVIAQVRRNAYEGNSPTVE